MVMRKILDRFRRPAKAKHFMEDEFLGSGPVTLGIEKEKAKCGKCRLPCQDTRPAILRLPYAALIAVGKRATSSITAPIAHATGRVGCGAAVGAAKACPSAEARPSST
jgi:hypothetical protein